MKKTFSNNILGIDIAVTNIQETVDIILSQLHALKGNYICFANVYKTMQARKNEALQSAMKEAFLTLPEGSPLALVQRLRGYKTAETVSGVDLMNRLCKATENTEVKHYFYGSDKLAVEKLREVLEKQYPELKLAGIECGENLPLAGEEVQALANRINESGADILWVDLPEDQLEDWMYAQHTQIDALMIGVEQAFSYQTGSVKRAPKWMRENYLEWFYRLCQDPKRLGKRYVINNLKFTLWSIPDAFTWKKRTIPDKKNLLIYAHYYYPDVASTGQILTELAEGLNDRFHTTVICTVPSYTGQISQHYRRHQYYFENINGVDVMRIRVPEFRKNFALSRIINIVSYFLGAIAATYRVGNQDYVFTISQPPVLGGLLGIFGKHIKRAKLIYNIQDFNPEQIQAVKFTGNPLIIKTMMYLDKLSCKQADKIIIVGRDMVETLQKRFEKLPIYAHINNWIDEQSIVPLAAEHEKVVAFKKRYGLEDKLVIMYSGNIGLYYDLMNILKLIQKFESHKDVVFAFVGAGSVLEEMKAYQEKEQMQNVVFIPYQDKEDLVYSLNAGDIHFVVNAKGIKGVSVPSKLYGVMAAGKPVFGVLEDQSEAQLIIEESGCGLTATPGDYPAIEALMHQFIQLRGSDALDQMGAKGREYLERNLTKKVSISKYYEEIMSCK